MGQKKTIPITAEVTTTDNAWTTLATLAISANCVMMLKDIFVVGRDTVYAEMASARAEHRARRYSGALALVGNIVFLVTHNAGSDSNLATTNSRITVSGDNLLLQVRGVTGRTIAWYGGFTCVQN